MAKKIDLNGLDHFKEKENAMIASEYSSSKTYAVGDYVYHNGTLYKCTTAITTAEAWTSGHWTAAKLADDCSGLMTAVNEVEELTIVEESETETKSEDIFPNLTWSNGYMGKDGIVRDASGTTFRYSQKYPVEAGDVLAFSNTNFLFSYITAFNGETVVPNSGQQGGNSYTVPDGIDGVIISEYTSRGTAAIIHTYTRTTVTVHNAKDAEIAELDSRIDTIEDGMDTGEYLEQHTKNIYSELTWTNNAYMSPSGGEVTANGLRYSNKIAVTDGDIIRIQNPTYTIRFVTAFVDDAAVLASGTSDINSYTVPQGINYVVITTYMSNGDEPILLTDVQEKNYARVKTIPMGYLTEAGNLSNGDELILPYMNVKNGNRYVFNANITDFDAIKFRKSSTAQLVVDGTNIVITNNGAGATIPHGLTIGSNITLIIENETSVYTSLIRLSSDGAEFSYTTPVHFCMDSANAYIESQGSTLTECRFSWVSANVNAPIWIFGDSYLSFYDERWSYYAARDELLKCSMLNGYAGQASAHAYVSLENLLEITTPKTMVWCLGMNDPDSETAVNASWKQYYDRIVELQKQYGFELVLYTVPSTPTMNNTFKNAIIRQSGYRYIEADLAVRVDDSGNWVTGALASDNVHPTAIGAKILYYRILADLPEMMCNY